MRWITASRQRSSHAGFGAPADENVIVSSPCRGAACAPGRNSCDCHAERVAARSALRQDASEASRLESFRQEGRSPMSNFQTHGWDCFGVAIPRNVLGEQPFSRTRVSMADERDSLRWLNAVTGGSGSIRSESTRFPIMSITAGPARGRAPRLRCGVGPGVCRR